MQEFIIQEKSEIDDGIGGIIEGWEEFRIAQGYIDLITGTDQNTAQNAMVEQSTHVLIIPNFTPGITDNMRVVDKDHRWYSITYSDDPIGQGHHNELYLNYGGILDGQ